MSRDQVAACCNRSHAPAVSTLCMQVQHLPIATAASAAGTGCAFCHLAIPTDGISDHKQKFDHPSHPQGLRGPWPSLHEGRQLYGPAVGLQGSSHLRRNGGVPSSQIRCTCLLQARGCAAWQPACHRCRNREMGSTGVAERVSTGGSSSIVASRHLGMRRHVRGRGSCCGIRSAHHYQCQLSLPVARHVPGEVLRLLSSRVPAVQAGVPWKMLALLMCWLTPVSHACRCQEPQVASALSGLPSSPPRQGLLQLPGVHR